LALGGGTAPNSFGIRPKLRLLLFAAGFKEANVKRELILSAAILSFLAVAPAYAQEQEKEKPQETKPAQTPNEEHKPVDTKKAPKQQTQAPKEQQQSKEQQKQDEKSAKQQQQTQKQQEQAAKQQKAQQGVAKQQQQEDKQQKKEQKQVAKQQEQESRNQRAGSEQRDNGGQRGQRIPDDRFRAHFGHEHHFRVSVHDRNHFSYGGYVFEFVDPWPVYWSYDDDCYIEEIGGAYYLFDVAHPGVRILVIVVG
jgi:DNA polymerase III gamma/tau subunit